MVLQDLLDLSFRFWEGVREYLKQIILFSPYNLSDSSVHDKHLRLPYFNTSTFCPWSTTKLSDWSITYWWDCICKSQIITLGGMLPSWHWDFQAKYMGMYYMVMYHLASYNLLAWIVSWLVCAQPAPWVLPGVIAHGLYRFCASLLSSC